LSPESQLTPDDLNEMTTADVNQDWVDPDDDPDHPVAHADGSGMLNDAIYSFVLGIGYGLEQQAMNHALGDEEFQRSMMSYWMNQVKSTLHRGAGQGRATAPRISSTTGPRKGHVSAGAGTRGWRMRNEGSRISTTMQSFPLSAIHQLWL
jgi:hypothetical protein